ncbi:segregation/condensation protein A [Thermobrachium celere]|uniref:Segregation and condensation protein A n=1 Tax=Thermobrachium celere DSM 8682 TaxID=941824 RepID=R7RSC1_9CLOT|nr:segregation/condensation protein A [Thermobrachium celere]GFR34292.1 segregation and condensation protein A [Thermobrachium celere]CDF58183.1 Segregation and condensation protein A [Thermobrachium celere DSM 8682]
MSINIKIEVFEGPLDLLLHLIKKAEVDIYDIPIAEITEQYIQYLKAMEELNLDIASEFLVMAATLLEIKSKMLLPKKKSQDDEKEEDDPRKEIVEKLIEYKKYKEFAEKLKMIEEQSIIFFKPPEIIDDIESKEVFFKNITLENLMFAFKKVMEAYERRSNKKSLVDENISHDEFRIEDKMQYIIGLIEIYKRIRFQRFFEEASCRLELIVTFLAMLELIKLKKIKVYQRENFDDIYIEGQDEEWQM